jgi:hypothetical protein
MNPTPQERKKMITHLKFHMYSFALLAVALATLGFVLAAQPANAAPQQTIVGGVLLGNTTWTLGGSPYLVDSYIDVPVGVTLTIEAGVVVGNYDGDGSQSYNFDVEGTLVVGGGSLLPVHFLPGLTGWSGINITGQPGAINTGSSLSYVIVDGGGWGGSGVAANLRLQYSEVEVHHGQFINSPGDGILGDDASAQGVANIYDCSFIGNAGYAVYFQDGSVNPVLSNLTASGNGTSLPYGGNLVALNDATLLPGEHIWENMGLPYLIWGTSVGPGSELDIEPGVQILAEPGNDALDVQGGILGAFGTPSQPIRFDPADAASGWSGIAIMGEEGNPSAGGWFDHVIITKGGFTGGSCDLYVTYGNASVTNSQLGSSEDSGVCLDHGATLVMTDTQLINNQEYAMDVIDAGARFTLDNLYATGNLSDTIGIGYGTITGEHVWPKSGIDTYDIYGAVTIAPTGTLNIESGLTILFGETRDITVRGTLNAIGTPADPITFTGETPTPGQWAGVNFWGTPEQHAVGRLAYTTFEYGGYGGSALISIADADVTFTNCILRYCSSDAIKIFPPAQNRAGGQFVALAALPVSVNWSQLYAAGGYAINNNATQPVQAAYDWWGDASGPEAEGNPSGTGSALTGPVNYWPYLVATDSNVLFMPLLVKTSGR